MSLETAEFREKIILKLSDQISYFKSVFDAWLVDQQPAEAKATGKPTCRLTRGKPRAPARGADRLTDQLDAVGEPEQTDYRLTLPSLDQTRSLEEKPADSLGGGVTHSEWASPEARCTP